MGEATLNFATLLHSAFIEKLKYELCAEASVHRWCGANPKRIVDFLESHA